MPLFFGPETQIESSIPTAPVISEQVRRKFQDLTTCSVGDRNLNDYCAINLLLAGLVVCWLNCLLGRFNGWLFRWLVERLIVQLFV